MLSPQSFLCAALSLLLAGCGAFPVYKPAAGQLSTQLKVSGGGTLSFKACGRPETERNSLEVDPKTLVTQIPADGRPITINAYLSDAGYQVTHYCNTRLNFYPRPGVTYLVNAGMVSEGRCFIELAREDLSTVTGVAFETSVRPGSC